MDSAEPTRIGLTVISGRNFQGKKKGADQCHASVVFGLGKELYQTETIQSSEPYWNQEAFVNVAGKLNDSLIFKIKDQGHTVGIVKIPIRTITRKKRDEWHPIQPYKKEKDFQGELRLKCFISETKRSAESTPPTSNNEVGDETTGERKKGGLFHGALNMKLSPPSDTSEATGHDINSPVLSDDDSSGFTPEVTGVSPSEGGMEGNERVILRGSNLGESKEDIVSVTVAGVDCSSTVEYYSSGKLVVTTLSRKTPGKGPVVVETVSGGVGVSSLEYCYTSSVNSTRLKPSLDSSSVSPLIGRKLKLTDQEINELQTENKSLKQQLKELKDSNKTFQEDNTALRQYVEELLSTIVDHKPELLEIAHRKGRKEQ